MDKNISDVADSEVYEHSEGARNEILMCNIFCLVFRLLLFYCPTEDEKGTLRVDTQCGFVNEA